MLRQPPPLGREFMKGVWDENPVLVQVLGMCPVLAVTTSATNGFAMGMATMFVLVSASTFVSILRKIIPHQVRIATYMVVIASFVTIADLVLAAEFPAISKSLGPYVPLIVVNCVILGRSEAFASKNGVGRSLVDALGNAVGFLLALVALGGIRELIGTGSLFGAALIGAPFKPWLIMILPAGAFLTLGVGLGLIRQFTDKETA
jgi:Na+-translocating ferredoxin:NAD+ oxidoreductase subunit E